MPLKALSLGAELQAKLTPMDVLQRLEAGNARFVAAKQAHKDHVEDRLMTATQGQYPMAIVLGCVDSRSIANLIFDEGIGSMFVARVAGNVADRNIIGSMDFATHFAGAKLIVVMGHTSCGAVQAACTGEQTGSQNLDQLLKQIEPAVVTVRDEEGAEFSCNSDKTIDAVAKQNVLDQIHYILTHSRKIPALIKEGKLMVVGSMHNLKTGKVTFFDKDGKPL